MSRFEEGLEVISQYRSKISGYKRQLKSFHSLYHSKFVQYTATLIGHVITTMLTDNRSRSEALF